MGQPRRAASIAATSIFFIVIIAWKTGLVSSPPAAELVGAARAMLP